MKIHYLLCCLLLMQAAAGQQQLIYKDDFSRLTANWKVEIASPDSSKVFVKNNSLIIDSKAGATIWLNKKLSGDLVIEYDRSVLLNYSMNSRLSDFNQFWQASDPRQKDLFTRNGKLESYDSLSLYYFGFGGNSNTTTRFRKYEGNGNRRLIREYLDTAHLLRPGVSYHVKTSVAGKRISVWINDILYFDYIDPDVLKSGYFGFRLTWSTQSIQNFKIYRPANMTEKPVTSR